MLLKQPLLLETPGLTRRIRNRVKGPGVNVKDPALKVKDYSVKEQPPHKITKTNLNRTHHVSLKIPLDTLNKSCIMKNELHSFNTKVLCFNRRVKREVGLNPMRSRH